MTYISRPMGNRLGIHADKIDELRQQAGLTPSGFLQDGTDDAEIDKKTALAEVYRCADIHLPSGAGGPASLPNSEAEVAQEYQKD